MKRYLKMIREITENKQTIKFLHVFSFVFFILMIGYYIFLLAKTYFYNQPLGPFDESLRFLSSLYTSNGFFPYTDFSFVYPPGLILKSHLFSGSLQKEIHLLLIITSFISLAAVSLVLAKTKSFFYSGVLILLIIINFGSITTSYGETLWLMWILSLLAYIKSSNKYALLLTTALGIWVCLFKWERIVLVTLLTTLPLLFCPFIKKCKKLELNILKNVFISFLVSILSSVCFLYLYLLVQGSSLLNALYFIFIVPFKIAPYRKLPFFSEMMINDGKILYFFLLVFSGLILYFVYLQKARRLETIHIFFITIPLSVLPYALGRVDIPHGIPLFTTITVIVLFLTRINKIFFILLGIIILYLSHSFSLITFYKQLVFSSKLPDITNNQLTRPLVDCIDKTKNLSYNTLFVGRTDYSQFLINYASLYLINPAKKPATNYISDEPGLQNNCYDGEIIASDLTSAQKPMLAFIETTKQHTEPNASAHMKSCGHIERWLSKQSYAKVASCKIENAVFEIRLYK